MMFDKRGQAWSMDIVIAVIIFTLGIVIFLIYSTNQSMGSKEKLDLLSYEGDNIFKSILSNGYPEDWNNATVKKIGIISNDRINETKLERFYNLSLTDYNSTRSLFNTQFHYFFYINNMTINSIQINGIGKPGTNIATITDNATHLIKITRSTVYNQKLATVYLYVWEEE